MRGRKRGAASASSDFDATLAGTDANAPSDGASGGDPAAGTTFLIRNSGRKRLKVTRAGTCSKSFFFFFFFIVAC